MTSSSEMCRSAIIYLEMELCWYITTWFYWPFHAGPVELQGRPIPGQPRSTIATQPMPRAVAHACGASQGFFGSTRFDRFHAMEMPR
jgi:hypothetical protein